MQSFLPRGLSVYVTFVNMSHFENLMQWYHYSQIIYSDFIPAAVHAVYLMYL